MRVSLYELLQFTCMEKIEVSIEKVTKEDIEEIEKIESSCFKLLLPKDTYYKSLDQFFRCAVINGEIVGYILGSYNDFEGEIIEIAVAMKHRHKHIAKRLIQDFVDFLGSREYLYLEVKKDNIPAISLYEKIGFEMYNVRKNYYRDGTDAILYRKKLIA